MKLKSISIYILFLTEKCCKLNTDSLTTLHLAPLIFYLTVQPDTWHLTSHLAGEYQAEEDGDSQLAVTEEDDVEQVWVGGVLQEKPETEKFL